MADDVKFSPSAPPVSPANKSRGRPRLTVTESPQERIKRLQAELHHAHEAQKIAEQHRAEMVGSIVLKHANTDESFRRQLAVILRSSLDPGGDIKGKNDIVTVRELAVELESKPHS